MARLFKSTYTVTLPDGSKEQRKAASWYGEYSDLIGKTRRVALSENKEASRRALDALVDGLAKASAHVTVEPRDVPPMVRKVFFAALRRAGNRQGLTEAATRPLGEHIKEWQAALIAKGSTQEHAERSANRVRRIIDGCRFKYWEDLSASRAQAYLADLRKDSVRKDGGSKEGLSIESTNHYLRALKSFARWMHRDGRVGDNPIGHLQIGNARTDRRRMRRALTVDELLCLLDVTANGPERYDMPAVARAMLYRVAVETGLRAGELRSLTAGSFDLAADQPTVTVAAAYSKRRREDVQPMGLDLADAVQEFLGEHETVSPAFVMPNPSHLARMLRADLEAARAEWIKKASGAEGRKEREKSSFLQYRDDAGRVADFHSLRHTYITNLARGGVHPKVAQTLARHSTITLTMDSYTHSARGELTDALNVLPDLGASQREKTRQRATGTHGAASYDEQQTRAKAAADRKHPALHSAGNSADFSAERGAGNWQSDAMTGNAGRGMARIASSEIANVHGAFGDARAHTATCGNDDRRKRRPELKTARHGLEVPG